MIIIYFFEGTKEKGIFGIFDLFASDSADSSVLEGKYIFFPKIRSLVLNFVFHSFFDRLGIFLFFYWIKKKKQKKKKKNDLVAQSGVTYFHDSSKRVGIFLDA